MKLVDLRKKPLSDFDMNDADGYARQADLRVVFDEHAPGFGSPGQVKAAREALASLCELYGNARGIDESLQPHSGRWALNWHIISFLPFILDYADAYGADVPPSQTEARDWVRMGTDDFVRDFCEAFEEFCSVRHGAEARLLLWRCAASLCRIYEDHCWTHPAEFDESSRVEIHPVATLDDIARVTAIPNDRTGCTPESIVKAFGCPAPDADASAALHAITELCTAAARVTPVSASSPSDDDQSLAAFSEFCMLIRQKSTAVFGLYNVAEVGYDEHCAWTAELTDDGKAFLATLRAASQSWPCWRANWPETHRAFAESARLAVRAWCNLVLDPRCKLLGPIMAWLHHCLRLHCEWKIAGMCY
ncbi:MAG TPA: hypothetical protein VM223_01385 [Planctomycetota bacterium]|nr:hypothetical protein [Planctomycetota bacterium]